MTRYPDDSAALRTPGKGFAHVPSAPSASGATLREALEYAQRIVDTVREPMLVLDHALQIRTASRAFCCAFDVSGEDIEGQFIYDLGNGQWDIPALRVLLDGVLNDAKNFRDFEAPAMISRG